MPASAVFAATQDLVQISLDSPARPRPRRESMLSRRGLDRCAAIFTSLPFNLPIASVMSPTKTVHTTKATTPNSCRSPRRYPEQDTFRLRPAVTPAQDIITRYREKLALEAAHEQPDTLAQKIRPDSYLSQEGCDMPVIATSPAPLSPEPSIRVNRHRDAEMRQAVCFYVSSRSHIY